MSSHFISEIYLNRSPKNIFPELAKFCRLNYKRTTGIFLMLHSQVIDSQDKKINTDDGFKAINWP